MDKLGIQPVQLVTQIFNFVVMVIVLTKLLYQPILKMLDERKKKIEEGLALTEKMKEEEEKLQQKHEQILHEARDEAGDIIEEGKKSGKKLEKEIIEKAHLEAKDVLEKARRDIALEREEQEKKLSEKAVEISLAMAQKLLQDALDDKSQRLILEKKLKQLAKLN